jgi:DNA polymerase (family 10)
MMGGKATKQENKVSRAAVEAVWADMLPLLEEFTLRAAMCGSYRRGKELVGDIDVVMIPVTTHVKLSAPAQELYRLINIHGKRTSILRPSPEGPVQVDFYIATEDDWGAQVMTWTGSAGFNIKTRARAKRMGFKLSQYGLEKEGRLVAGHTEQEIFAALGMAYVPPNERNDEKPKWRGKK